MAKKNWATPVLRVMKLEETRSGTGKNAENNNQANRFVDAAGSL